MQAIVSLQTLAHLSRPPAPGGWWDQGAV